MADILQQSWTIIIRSSSRPSCKNGTRSICYNFIRVEKITSTIIILRLVRRIIYRLLMSVTIFRMPYRADVSIKLSAAISYRATLRVLGPGEEAGESADALK